MKPYYDLDKYVASPEDDDGASVHLLRKAIQELYGPDCSIAFAENSRWVTKDGVKRWKCSYHAVVLNIKTVVADVKWSAQQLTGRFTLPIDMAVYSARAQAFRLCGSYKWDDPGKVPMKLLVNESPPDITLEDLMVSRFPTSRVFTERHIMPEQEGKAEAPRRKQLVVKPAEGGEDPIRDQLQTMVGDPKIFGVVQQCKHKDGQAIMYPVLNRDQCLLNETVKHRSNNAYLIVLRSSEVIYKRHSAKCEGKEVSLGFLPAVPDVPQPPVVHDQGASYFHYAKVSNEDEYCQDHTPAAGERCRVITAAPGRGKSEQIIRTMEFWLRQNPECRFVYVIPRRTLACSTKTRLERALNVDAQRIVLYSEANAFEVTTQILIVQYESLRRIPIDGPAAYFDVVIVDETRSVVNQMTCWQTNRNNIKHNYHMMRSLIHLSQYAMFCDADHEVDEASATLVYSLFQASTIFAERYTFAQHMRTVRIMNFDAWVDQICADLKSGLKVGVALGTRRTGDYVLKRARHMLPDLVSKYYNGQGDDNERNADLEDVQVSWAAPQLVMFTATITQGVDCQLLFNKVYLHGHSFGPAPRDAMQQVGRFRRVEDTTIYTALEATPPPENHVRATHATMIEEIKVSYAAKNEAFNQLVEFKRELGEDRRIVAVPELFTSLLANTRAEESNKEYDYLRSFVAMCKYRGYHIMTDRGAWKRSTHADAMDTTIKTKAFDIVQATGYTVNHDEADVKAGFATAIQKQSVSIFHSVKHFHKAISFQQFEEIENHMPQTKSLVSATKHSPAKLMQNDAAMLKVAGWIEAGSYDASVLACAVGLLRTLGCESLDPVHVHATEIDAAKLEAARPDIKKLIALTATRCRAKTIKGMLSEVLARVFGLHLSARRLRKGKKDADRHYVFSLSYITLKAWDATLFEVAAQYVTGRPVQDDDVDFDTWAAT